MKFPSDDARERVLAALTYQVGSYQAERLTAAAMEAVLEAVANAIFVEMSTAPPALPKHAAKAPTLSAKLMAPMISSRRIDVLRWVVESGPITCDGLEVLYGISHSSASSALNWLERHELVYRAHETRRRTRSGGQASPYGPRALGLRTLEVLDQSAKEQARLDALGDAL
jgi:DNA-binding transcriptional ArsR family regulator